MHDGTSQAGKRDKENEVLVFVKNYCLGSVFIKNFLGVHIQFEYPFSQNCKY